MSNPHTRRIVAELFQGKMQPCPCEPINPNLPNFVICCRYGDWSGYRSLVQCQEQYKELESKGRPDGYFWVEER